MWRAVNNNLTYDFRRSNGTSCTNERQTADSNMPTPITINTTCHLEASARAAYDTKPNMTAALRSPVIIPCTLPTSRCGTHSYTNSFTTVRAFKRLSNVSRAKRRREYGFMQLRVSLGLIMRGCIISEARRFWSARFPVS